MKIEILIFCYLAVCASMIVFNVVAIFWYRRNDVKLASDSEEFEKRIREQIESGVVDEEHRKYLSEKLTNEKYLMAFDNTLEGMYGEHAQELKLYFKQLVGLFINLTRVYAKKDEIKAAYFPYIVNKYRFFEGENSKIVIDSMYNLLRNKSVYCRENALYALYSMGNTENVITALRIIDSGENYHNGKLITDGLITFTGDKAELDEALWANLKKFTVSMQVAILNYFRFSGSKCYEQMFALLQSNCDSELQYSAIRYFGRNYYEPAYEVLMNLAANTDPSDWEYVAIAVTALASYKNDRTIALLKKCLSHRNWYVRYNSSQALENMGLGYEDLIDIIEGDDRYASDIVKYRIDHKNMMEMERKQANV